MAHTVRVICTLIILCAPLNTVLASELVVTGDPRVVDADTLVINGDRIRLHGIDAPETKQLCIKENAEYECGKQATTWLREYIGDASITCVSSKKDRYKRLIAVCTLGGVDVNAAIVEAGWAVAYRHYSKDYVDEEMQAEKVSAGIWAGIFELPWKWRKKNK
jgi:endonuclease YncB( thermonuclease family)